MARYEYTAKKWNGEELKGTIDAKSVTEAKVKVRDKGYKLVSLKELTASPRASCPATIRSKPRMDIQEQPHLLPQEA